MKLNKEDALRWLEQAEHNLRVAENNLKANFIQILVLWQTKQHKWRLRHLLYIIKRD
jgi:HEPN domain-containing protein